MEKKHPILRLWQLIVQDKKEIISIYFYAILGGMVQLSVPLGVQAIIGFVLGATMTTSIYVLIILVVIGVLISGILQINQMKIIEKIQQNLFARHSFDFASKIPKLDLSKMDPYYLPEKINRFFDIATIQKGLSKLLLDIPTASIQIILGLLLLGLYHPFFIVFGLLLVLILWLLLKYSGKRGLESSIVESNYKYKVAAWLQEMGRGIQSFKSKEGANLNLQKTDDNVLGYIHARTDHFSVLLLQYRALVIFKVIITTAMLSIGTFLLLDQQLNLGEFIAAEIVILMVIGAVEKLITNLDSVYDVITGLEKISTVTENTLEHDGHLPFEDHSKGMSIEMIDFGFTFPDGKRIFSNIALSIPSNTTVCITGAENAGKSSLLKVLSGNYTHFSGTLLFNQIPYKRYQLETVRSKIGIFLTKEDVFEGTAWENISMGRESITEEKIAQIALAIGIESFISGLPNGLDTEIDSIGKKIAGTTVKKLLLLRSLANDPKLLLLEEPWEGLEPMVKTKMIGYLLNPQSNRTTLVVSNDQSFADQCDYRLHISKGSITLRKNR